MAPTPIALGIFGASGRMGSSVANLIELDYPDRAELVATVSRGAGNIQDFSGVDAVIDFSLPAGTARLAEWLARYTGDLPVYVCGTTGLTDEQLQKLRELSERTCVLHANNFSPGLVAFAKILRSAAPVLQALAYRPEIIESHHRHKLDAPSGTARLIRDVLMDAQFEEPSIESRREGEIVGQHDVVFSGIAEQITIGHNALDRTLFARGAIEAALWLCDSGAPQAYYTMDDYFLERFGF